jgi:hypothetical protein
MLRELFTIGLIATTLVGCDPKESAERNKTWHQRLRQQLDQAESSFFGPGALPDNQDPLNLSFVGEFLSNASGPLPGDMQEQLDSLVKHSRHAIEILDGHFRETQDLYAVSAILPAVEAHLILETLESVPEVKTAAYIGQLAAMLENESLYDAEKLKYHDEAIQKALSLGHKIQKRVLQRTSKIDLSGLSPEASQSLLDSIRAIRILNPEICAKAGYQQVLNPKAHWRDLSGHYLAVIDSFEIAAAALNGGSKNVKLDWQKLRAREVKLLAELKAEARLQHDQARVVIGPSG